MMVGVRVKRNTCQIFTSLDKVNSDQQAHHHFLPRSVCFFFQQVPVNPTHSFNFQPVFLISQKDKLIEASRFPEHAILYIYTYILYIGFSFADGNNISWFWDLLEHWYLPKYIKIHASEIRSIPTQSKYLNTCFLPFFHGFFLLLCSNSITFSHTCPLTNPWLVSQEGQVAFLVVDLLVVWLVWLVGWDVAEWILETRWSKEWPRFQ